MTTEDDKKKPIEFVDAKPAAIYFSFERPNPRARKAKKRRREPRNDLGKERKGRELNTTNQLPVAKQEKKKKEMLTT